MASDRATSTAAALYDRAWSSRSGRAVLGRDASAVRDRGTAA